MAWCYDAVADCYSLGRVRAAKRAHLREVGPGDRVLYAGAGTGEEALLAAQRGARVAAVDCSPAMLDRLRRRFEAAGASADLYLQDLFEHRAPGDGYDVVAAHFVLNVFAPGAMRAALAHLAAQLRPGGRLVVADFAPASGGRLARRVARSYFRSIDLAGWALGLAALHPLYDTAAAADGLGLRITRRERFRPLAAGPPLYESWTAVKDDSRTAAEDDSWTAVKDDSRTAAEDDTWTAVKDDSAAEDEPAAPSR